MADIHDEIARRLGRANAVCYHNVRGFSAPLALVYRLPDGELFLERTDGKLFRADKSRWWSLGYIEDYLGKGSWIVEDVVLDLRRVEGGPVVRSPDDLRER